MGWEGITRTTRSATMSSARNFTVLCWLFSWSCLVTAVQADMWFSTSYSGNSGCNRGGNESSGEEANPASNSSSSSAASSTTTSTTQTQQQGSSSVDAKTIVTQVFLILAVGVAMSMVLLVFTYLQLKYCKNCGRSGVARASSSSRGEGGGRAGRSGAAAVDTSLAAQANLTGMTKKERSDVLEHLFRPYMVVASSSGEGSSFHPYDDAEKGGVGVTDETTTSTPPSHHTASREGESYHNNHNDRVWETDEPSKDFSCSICLSALNRNGPVLVTPWCNHKFHYKCCREWLQKRDTCPYCRTHLFTVDQLRTAALDVLGKDRLEQLGANPDILAKATDVGTVVEGADSASTASAAAPAVVERRDESV